MWCVWKCSLIILSVLSVSVISQVPLSPCPRIFSYATDGPTWYGIITLSPPYGKTINLTVSMDVPLQLVSNYVGRIELQGDKSDILKNLIMGKDLNYKVTFPVLDAIPTVTSIVHNNKIICNGPRAQANIVSSVQLFHNLNTKLSNDNYDTPQNIPNNNANFGSSAPSLTNANVNTNNIRPNTQNSFANTNVNQNVNHNTNRPIVTPQQSTNNVNNNYNYNNNQFNAVTTRKPINEVNFNNNQPTNLNPFYNVAGVSNQQSFIQTHKKETETHNYQYNQTNFVLNKTPVLNNRFSGDNIPIQNTAQQTFSHQFSTHKVSEQHYSEQHSNTYHLAGQQIYTGNNNINKQSNVIPSTTQTYQYNNNINNQPSSGHIPQPSIPVPSYAPSANKIENERPNPDTFALYGKEQTTINPAIRRTLLAKDLVEIQNVCGKPKKRAGKSSNNTINKGSWPWLAAIFLKKISGIEFQCGGVLISKDIIVTASHCVRQFNNRPARKEEIIVKLGAHNIQDWTDENTKTHAVVEVISHPEYDGNLALVNDVALLRINRITFNDYILPACLLTNSNPNVQDGSVVGWGYNENGQIIHSEPHLAKQKFVSHDECRRAEPTFSIVLSNTTFCTKTNGASASCDGDSGSGILIKYNDRWWLRGITSTLIKNESSRNSCKISNYVIFTDLTKYSNWINSQM